MTIIYILLVAPLALYGLALLMDELAVRQPNELLWKSFSLLANLLLFPSIAGFTLFNESAWSITKTIFRKRGRLVDNINADDFDIAKICIDILCNIFLGLALGMLYVCYLYADVIVPFLVSSGVYILLCVYALRRGLEWILGLFPSWIKSLGVVVYILAIPSLIAQFLFSNALLWLVIRIFHVSIENIPVVEDVDTQNDVAVKKFLRFHHALEIFYHVLLGLLWDLLIFCVIVVLENKFYWQEAFYGYLYFSHLNKICLWKSF